jgi:site-specific DNA-methyltransferase (cytosine-N4-specific)
MKPYLEDADFKLYEGDAAMVLAGLPERSVHMAACSPPYWNLRDYGTASWIGGDAACDHKAPFRGGGIGGSTLGPKRDGLSEDNAVWAESRRHHQYRGQCEKCGAVRQDLQLGLEDTPDEYVGRLCDVMDEVWRVLRDDGTLWLNLGDTYAADHMQQRLATRGVGISGNRGLHAKTIGSMAREGRATPPGLKPKDLVGVPWRVAFEMQRRGWWLRNEIIWQKPDPLPESVTDRFARSHETIFLFSKRAKYFFDHVAVREPNVSAEQAAHNIRYAKSYAKYDNESRHARQPGNVNHEGIHARGAILGRNGRTVWTVTTQSFGEAHFATWPEKLVSKMILAGTSEVGCCPECAAPWRHVVEQAGESVAERLARSNVVAGRQTRDIMPRSDGGHPQHSGVRLSRGAPIEDEYWLPTCKHYDTDQVAEAWTTQHYPTIPGIVLDPFMGSGTTALAARKLGRHSVGVELSAEYCGIAARRLAQQSLLA